MRRSLAALARSLDRAADQICAGELLDIGPPEADDDPGAAEVAAAAARLVAAVQRLHALEAAVHELFEAMSSHLRLDYLSYEALYRVLDHTGAAGGAIVLTGDGPPDVVASVEFALEGAPLELLIGRVPPELGPIQLDAPEAGVPVVAVPFSGDSGPLARRCCSTSGSNRRCGACSRCSRAPSASRSATRSRTRRSRPRPRPIR